MLCESKAFLSTWKSLNHDKKAGKSRNRLPGSCGVQSNYVLVIIIFELLYFHKSIFLYWELYIWTYLHIYHSHLVQIQHLEILLYNWKTKYHTYLGLETWYLYIRLHYKMATSPQQYIFVCVRLKHWKCALNNFSGMYHNIDDK